MPRSQELSCEDSCQYDGLRRLYPLVSGLNWKKRTDPASLLRWSNAVYTMPMQTDAIHRAQATSSILVPSIVDAMFTDECLADGLRLAMPRPELHLVVRF